MKTAYRIVENTYNNGKKLYVVERKYHTKSIYGTKQISWTPSTTGEIFNTFDAAVKHIDECKSVDLVSEKVVYWEELA